LFGDLVSRTLSVAVRPWPTGDRRACRDPSGFPLCRIGRWTRPPRSNDRVEFCAQQILICADQIEKLVDDWFHVVVGDDIVRHVGAVRFRRR
jgi:hypothetical protein